MSDSMHQLFWEMRHFPYCFLYHFQRWRISFFSQFPRQSNVRRAILEDANQGRRLKMLHFSSFGTKTKHLFTFSKEGDQNAEVFVEHSQSRVRDKGLWIKHSNWTNINRQKCLSKVTKRMSSSALYLRKKVTFAKFWRNLWNASQINRELISSISKKCDFKPPKTRFWVLCTFLRKSSF